MLASIDPTEIPAPSKMPLHYLWSANNQNYREKNGEVMVAVWLVPKGGSLFGDIDETDVHVVAPEGEDKLEIPEPYANVVADATVPMPINVLRRELWGRADSPSMKSHLEEKLLKKISIGEWKQAESDET